MTSSTMPYIGGEYPLTVKDWQLAATYENHLDRLLSHVQTFKESDPAWISTASEDHIRRQWQDIEARRQQGLPLTLLGVPFAVKDNIDVAGLPTTAACPGFAYTPLENASIVQTLLESGAVVVGKCNLDAFATGLVGTRSPFGAVPNTFDPKYISGGSSSGSASVVARGLVAFSLGTDTAGSGRVPAGLNNIVGLKATRGALSARGVVPACRSLDCISMFTLNLTDARIVFDACGVFDTADAYSRQVVTNPVAQPAPLIALCDNPPWFGGETQKHAYFSSLKRTQKLDWQLQPADFSALFELAALLYEGPWVAERYAAIRDFIERPEVQIDPTVRGIIEKAKNFNAADLFANEYLRQDLTRIIEGQFNKFDAIIVPTTPTFPTLEEVRIAPVEENSLLGTYTNFVNFLDWSAISIPAGFREDGLPFGLTIISTRWQEQKLFHLAEQYLSLESRRLGATRSEYRDSVGYPSPSLDQELAVVGAHLTGFPLNHQLLEVGATFSRVTKTAESYALYELPSTTNIRKPGLKRTSPTGTGAAIEVEVWKISEAGLGSFIKLVPSPLAIGSVELDDGKWIKGFVCESWGFDNALDITNFGGWRNYIKSLAPDPTPDTTETTQLTMKPISSVLVANRGEIAVRIIKTLKKLNIRSIAIHSVEDSKAQHVTDADEAYLLEGNSLEETYLSGGKIIKIAESSGAEGIIPGYGFLSESAEFARSCEDHGRVWIGPTPKQMEKLGLKHLARELAAKSSVPLLPGSGIVVDVEVAVSEASKIGYPVMVKSSAGGGGIGLSQCDDEQSLRQSFESIQHLGKSYFNDSRIFIEKFVKNARHVEVQIMGNGKGVVKHIGERDCSLQRRKQKVIEECPAVFIPEAIRKDMRRAAINLTSSVQYRGVGTVEFIYDLDQKLFYFLEVNTRLQVEHCVTEEATGLDLVEAMIKIASNNTSALFDGPEVSVNRVSIEARIYGESPLQNFRPSPGQILAVSFPENVRFDTWITSGTIVSASYDPLLAKLIVAGYDRTEALQNMAIALQATRIVGIETNLDYLRQIIGSEMFKNGSYTTTSLDYFEASTAAFEVLEAGASTTVQDYPGRVGQWHIGIPPSGPLDDYSFRLANRVLGNDEDAAGLECTSSGPGLLFHHDAHVAVVGGPAALYVNDAQVEYGRAIHILVGQTLRLGSMTSGSRAYIAVKGGLQVPKVLGSRSTFTLGKTGGHCGRLLRTGDIIKFSEDAKDSPTESLAPSLPDFTSSWTLRVLPGPHAFPDFLLKADFSDLFNNPWKVHYNSNRVGIRLTGPKPAWARQGGEAGLHPSNIHDSPYSIGSISFTGDQAVVLTNDGPSLGGFMIFATTITADLWKLGQLRPGDEIKLALVTIEEALSAESTIRHSIEKLSSLVEKPFTTQVRNPILLEEGHGANKVMYRQAGDSAILLEFGNDSFDIRTSARIYAVLEAHKISCLPGILELTTGVRALHIRYDNSVSQTTIVENLQRVISSLDQEIYVKAIPSRTIHLPLAFEHSSNAADVARYSQTIRSTAPWLPSNTDFLRRINGISTNEEINTALLSSPFLVLGLGDVFFGSPCAIPLDPRHRLFGMKYNPSRSFTSEGSVGVGGQYLCIYAIDSPGGYQLVGRTVPIWSKFGKVNKKWLFNIFDQISFYNVSEEVLNASREKGDGSELVRIEEGPFDLRAYETWLDEHKEDIERVKRQRMQALKESDAVAEALNPPPTTLLTQQKGDDELEEGAIMMRAGVAGKCWKVMVAKGDSVVKGQTLFVIEAMKMEIKINASNDGICLDVSISPGDILDADSRLAVFAPKLGEI